MEIFEEKGINGGDLVFSEGSRGYSSLVKSPNKSIKSDVVNTSISDCSFRCLSLDQIEEFVESANARYGASCLSEMDFNALFNDPLYESNPKKIICDSINFNLLSNDSSDNPDFLRQYSLYLSNSSLSSIGANSFNFLSEKIFEAVVCGFINEKNMLLSNITLIFYNPNSSFSFLDSCEKTFLDTSSFNFLPISIDQSVKPESFSCFSLANVSLFQANCLVLDSIQALTNPDQFISGESFIFSLTSEGMDSVIDTIFDLSPDYVNKRKDVEVFKLFAGEWSQFRDLVGIKYNKLFKYFGRNDETHT